MKLSIILTTILNTFATGTPNLCDDVYLSPTGSPYTDLLGQMLPRYCEWTGPDAPVWDADVCCKVADDGADCSPTDSNGRCWSGLKMYCEYGELVAGGGVVCYQPFPSMCDSGLCVQPPDVPPPGLPIHAACCSAGGVCQLIYDEQVGECQGYYLACEHGTLHEDGTVECYD
jgi:hypothetical protein